jgi:hypothetical protein
VQAGPGSASPDPKTTTAVFGKNFQELFRTVEKVLLWARLTVVSIVPFRRSDDQLKHL